MKEDLKAAWSGKDVLAVAVFLSLAAYIYAGFYFTDSGGFFLTGDSSRRLVTAARLLFPLVIAGAVYLFVGFRQGWIAIRSLLAILLSVVSFLFVAFLAGDTIYNRSIDKGAPYFHSYLQLAPPLIKDYTPGRFNIVCLGGSTTEFKDELGRDWPSLVEKAMRDKYQFPNIKIYNMGKQWYSSEHILIHYIQNVRKYHPKSIIVMEGINDVLHNADFSQFSLGGFREDYGNFYGPMIRVVKYGSFSKFLFQRVSGIWYQKVPVEVVTDQFPGLEPFERNIRALIALARADGTTVVLMTQPYVYKDVMLPEELQAIYMWNREAVGNGKKWAYHTALAGLRQYSDKVREIAAAEKVPLIDLEKAVPKNLIYFRDDVHYKKPGYDLVADVISERLARIFPMSARPGLK